MKGAELPLPRILGGAIAPSPPGSYAYDLNKHLSEHSPLANCQWGFQKGKSTV